ncbi:MAG: hypothetical protein GY857_01210 [Desulfobacula sp.]|nr:hypothetical protein [Desulfobacula sp.]
MKLKWLIIIIAVILADVQITDKPANPLVLISNLFKGGVMAWIETLALAAAVVTPSIFITKILERLTANFFPQYGSWKSFVIAVCITTICFLLVMLLLEPIKNV